MDAIWENIVSVLLKTNCAPKETIVEKDPPKKYPEKTNMPCVFKASKTTYCATAYFDKRQHIIYSGGSLEEAMKARTDFLEGRGVGSGSWSQRKI